MHEKEPQELKNFLGVLPDPPHIIHFVGPHFLCLPWAPPILSAALRTGVKLFWYITTPFLYYVVKYSPRPPSYSWNMASSLMHDWKQKNAEGGYLNRDCFQLYYIFPKLGKTR